MGIPPRERESQMALLANETSTCPRCKKGIAIGDEIAVFNRPNPRTAYHKTCPSESSETARETARETPPETAPEATQDDSGTSIDAVIDRRINKRLQGFRPETAINEDRVREIVREEATQTVTILIKRDAEDTGRKIEGAHYLMPRLLRLLKAEMAVYLYGPAGTGKTTALLEASKAFERPGEIDTLDPSTPKSGVMGYRTPTGEAVFTAFTRMYASGGFYIADEADNAPAHVQTLFNSALANGYAPAAWGLIERHPDFRFVAAGNTPFRPTPAFPDRRPGSAAFMDRLYFVHWPLDPNIERRACGRSPARIPARLGREREISAADWGRWVEEIRAWTVKNAPTIQVTPRATLSGLKALSVGETPEEVAHGLVFRGADDTLVTKALDACPLP